MKLISSAFEEGQIIPSKYTCEGENINPPLELFEVPSSTVSLCLIMDDPDVPPQVRSDRMYDHWVLYNLAPKLQKIPEDAPSSLGTLGKNTGGKNEYTGPCPPDREHRYFFKLYALDTMLSLKEGASKKDVEAAMHGHVLEECALMGRYEKGKGY